MIYPPKTEHELLARAENLAGKTMGQLVNELSLEGINVASISHPHKGAVGQWLEKYLGADAGNASKPDFTTLGIELKTLPINAQGKVSESTFVTAISLTNMPNETWKTSSVQKKLKRVLWVPVEGDKNILLQERRIGQAFLWTPKEKQQEILENDWQEFVRRIVLGQLETISAKDGVYLQIRPKAANGKSLSWGINEQGEKAKTLPRGFYLRANFTTEIYQEAVA